MRSTRALLVCLILFILTILPARAQSLLATNPLDMLQSHYNAINRHDYVEAYTYLRTQQDFFNFVAGYRTTERVDTYFGTFLTTGVNTGAVPAVLSGQQTSGAVESYAGCFLLQSQIANGQNLWFITGNNFSSLSLYTPLSSSSIRAFLAAVDCSNVGMNIPNVSAPATTEAETTIRAYFNAIEDNNYLAAYGLWLFPLPGPQPNGAPSVDYRPPLATFGAGYASTISIAVYTGIYQYGGPTAGHSYRDGFLPVVLIGMDRTSEADTIRAFYGCYAMGRFVDGRMGIINGKLNLLLEGTPTGIQIIDALNTDCANMGISM